MDQEFFVRELEAHSGLLYHVAYAILRNEAACEDAIQDAVLKAWEKRLTLREEAYFRTWMTRILINTCYDTQRKRRRIVFLADVPEPSVPPHDVTLAMAVYALPEKLRLPLVLFYSEGMSYAEIAQTLRIPITTVRGRIRRAKGELRKELGEHEA